MLRFRFVRRFTSSSGPPIRVGFTQNAGRGVFATRNIQMGELIHTAQPLLSHPAIQNISKVCYFCLRGISHPSDELKNSKKYHEPDKISTEAQTKFCSQACLDSAKEFYAVEKKANWQDFHQLCREQDWRHPLLVKRFICMIVSDTVKKDALDILSYMKPEKDLASSWMLTWRMLRDAFKGSGIPEEKLDFLSAEWYTEVMARISLNSFRVEILPQESEDLMAAAIASVTGDAIAGSAVYILPSMYNHDCDANVDISWPVNSTARLTALRDIEKGEELRITYIDATMPRSSRQQLLQQSYHFLCNCSRCIEVD